ncbi:hypothetical protein SNE25_20455 [Mucilaginibacter sabulilitoris]|uniref:DUF4861 domain-containing protein n=1 Tax=Mucilaginibacter sabulilitoris TaxID=1173583 RepID=A0ABZ0TET4_9SPHI|nr:hypothetical protein [Mucilaginibacter sabulilitoris]WPU91694.1 hypothetical protein SNE25_20455 [Mucilaginibacter sabulilitoris]
MFCKAPLLLALMFVSIRLFAQPAAPSDAKIITVDLTKNSFSQAIPYDKPLNLIGVLPDDKVTELKLYIKPGNFGSDDYIAKEYLQCTWEKKLSPNFTLPVDVIYDTKKYMEADHYYALEIIGKDGNGKVLLDFRYIINTISAPGDQIKMDFGILYASGPKMLSGEIAAHLYAVPVNDEADPVNFKGLSQNIFKRTSIYFGLSVAKFKSDTRQDTKNLVGIGNLVYGLSIHSPLYGWYGRHQVLRRLLQPMYFNFGQILFKQADANPLIVKDRNKTAFYVGVSYDFNFTALIAPLTKLFTP